MLSPMAIASAAALVYGTSQPSLATNAFYLCSPKPFSYHNRIQSLRSSTDYLRSLPRSVPICVIDLPLSLNLLRRPPKSIMGFDFQNQRDISSIFESGFALSMVVVVASATVFMTGAASAAEIPLLGSSSLQLQEPSNALSLPTWAIHVSSVVEWITAMILVWQYGEKSGFQSWKGLSWGMVPLLGGAFCACTWHFFYNSESLEILVALQAALTVIGNFTMCIAAFRIYKASQEGSENV